MRQRVRVPYALAVAEGLTPRDWAVLGTLRRCRVATGVQLQRLHFGDLGEMSAQVTRSRALRRLVEMRMITVSRRRTGGPGRGSAGPVYLLDTAGTTVLRMRTDPEYLTGRAVRPPTLPGDRYLAHILAVTELYVQAVEADRAGRFRLAAFASEPDAWWTTTYGRVLKPDAFVRVARTDPDRAPVTDRWWIEVDLDTETIATMTAKLRRYAKFAASGATGPGGLVPGVLITTPNTRRTHAIRTHAIPRTNADLFQVTDFADAIDTIHTILQT